MQVQAREERRAAQLAAPAHRDLTRRGVDRVRQILADRHARLHVDARAQVQPLQAVREALFAKGVAAVDVGDVPAVGVERADGELVAEQIELAGREVEQRADGRVRLAVVVAEVSFEVTSDAGDAPVRQQLPALRESLVKLYFDSAVIADRVGEAVSHAVSARIACGLAVRAKRRVADLTNYVTCVVFNRRIVQTTNASGRAGGQIRNSVQAMIIRIGRIGNNLKNRNEV